MKSRICWLKVVAIVFFMMPHVACADGWTYLCSDGDGAHYYAKNIIQISPGVVGVWTQLTYSIEGRSTYVAKRKSHGMKVDGFENLAYRQVFYELNCFSEKGEFAITEVRELSRETKMLDYAKAGSYKEWDVIPQGSVLERVHRQVCPKKR